jgi:hypothetical protein
MTRHDHDVPTDNGHPGMLAAATVRFLSAHHRCPRLGLSMTGAPGTVAGVTEFDAADSAGAGGTDRPDPGSRTRFQPSHDLVFVRNCGQVLCPKP